MTPETFAALEEVCRAAAKQFAGYDGPLDITLVRGDDSGDDGGFDPPTARAIFDASGRIGSSRAKGSAAG